MARKKTKTEAKPQRSKGPKRQRTEMCIHRRGPEQYCSRCDA